MANPSPATRLRRLPPPLAVADSTGVETPFPAPLTSLIGRDAETAAVSALLRRGDVRLVTLTGPGGVGKTRLALRVAVELATDFTDGILFVPLAAIADPALVLPTVARALGVRDTGERPLAEQLEAILHPRSLLLILDNLEQVLPAAAGIAQLLTACPRLMMLATSRGRLLPDRAGLCNRRGLLLGDLPTQHRWRPGLLHWPRLGRVL